MVGRGGCRGGERSVWRGVAECREGADRAGCVYDVLVFRGLVGNNLEHKLMNACFHQ